jgi:general nucleoside transport system permease protein
VADPDLATIGYWTAATLRSSTPLMMVTLGETLTQRVGIINLGIEGQMLAGACAGFAAAAATGDPLIGFALGAAAGVVLSALHAVLCLVCGSNQIGSGIAVWTLGLGLSSYFGRGFVGGKVTGLAPIGGPGLADIPLLGPVVTQLTPVAPAALALVILAGWWLYRTRTGLRWRIVGESLDVARALGLAPRLVQLQGILIGGLLSGFAGAILSVDYTQTWANDMTKGRGFVAVGLVIVARWNPFLVLPVVLIFGLSEAATLRMQASGITLSPYIIACLPYVVCLFCVIIASARERQIGGMPAQLASVFGTRR